MMSSGGAVCIFLEMTGMDSTEIHSTLQAPYVSEVKVSLLDLPRIDVSIRPGALGERHEFTHRPNAQANVPRSHVKTTCHMKRRGSAIAERVGLGVNSPLAGGLDVVDLPGVDQWLQARFLFTFH